MTDAFPSRAAVTCAALTFAYVASALVGLNRLVWIGTHQGRFYRTYWIIMFAASLVLFLWFWRSTTADAWRASAVGLLAGYAASCLAARMMYFQLGPAGPIDALHHEISTLGATHALSQTFVIPLLTGGVLFGMLTALTVFAIARRHARIATLLTVLVLIVAAVAFVAAPSHARFKHIHLSL
jgi:glucan phosphoethanolaminetransferase (alkaline phosphatase superfamily)